jgi:hypothetical protein
MDIFKLYFNGLLPKEKDVKCPLESRECEELFGS